MYLNKRTNFFGYAIKGVRIAWKEEANFRIHVIAALATLVLSWILNISRTEFTVILLTIGTVLTAEIFNTALEEFCDMVKSEHDPHIAKIKDLAAGAVFVSACFAFVVGLVIFLPRVLILL